MKKSDIAILNEAKETNQDFEWYPTTSEIINRFFFKSCGDRIESLLDIGAGNGKVLTEYAKLSSERGNENVSLMAMEKSEPLLAILPLEVSIMGTDFHESTLIDKKVDCIFCNPPYSEFVEWSNKIIREANAHFVYLVIPERWKDQREIEAALQVRNVEAEIVGEFDFTRSKDRKARAKVNLVKICMTKNSREYGSHYRNGHVLVTDPFEQWVDESFGLSAQKSKVDEDLSKIRNQRKEEIENELVAGSDLAKVLHGLYLEEMDHMLDNYRKVCGLDVGVFKELDISVDSIIKGLRSRITGLKDKYWSELFDNYEALKKRLTEKSRQAFISSIRKKTNIDFTPSNAYAVTAWAIRNANQYYDKQLVDTFLQMASLANVQNYSSNKRVYEKNDYRYNSWFGNKGESHYKLEYRIVLENCGGTFVGHSWERSSNKNGLSERAAEFLNDLLVVADNLGFARIDSVSKHEFERGKEEVFYAKNSEMGGEKIELFRVRAFQNQNMHVKMNSKFTLAFNVEAGRLLGWVHSAQEAAAEMGEDPEQVAKVFGNSYKALTSNTVALLSYNQEKAA